MVRQHLEAGLKNEIGQGSVPTGDHDLYAGLVEAAVRQRDQAALEQYAPLAQETATRVGHTLYTAIAHRACGVEHTLAGEYDQAAARLNQAMELFRHLDTRWQIGRTLYEWGELAGAEGKSGEAADYLHLALAAFQELHAIPDAARTRAVLAKLSPG